MERILEQTGFNGLPVVSGGTLVGFVTSLDLLEAFRFTPDAILPPYDEIMQRSVATVMTREPAVVQPSTRLTRVLEKMVETRNKGFPVVDPHGDRLVGVVAREDVMQALRRAGAPAGLSRVREPAHLARMRGAEPLRDQPVEWLADHLGAGAAEHLLGGGVEHRDALRLVHHHDRVHRRVDEPGQPRVALVALALGRAQLCDVDAGSDHARDRTRRGAHRGVGPRDPPASAVLREPVPINCTALPEGLLESELFGHVRGAFTGAHATKRGLFEKASGGTLFLDEIGDMSLPLQGKLLRVLQDGEVRPVGGSETTKVDVRIIAATNRDLGQAIDEGRFREDLFYRLNVIPVYVPPLRERPDDIPPLVEFFLRKHSPDRPRTVAVPALVWLRAQIWRGNARELENAIERALVLAEGDEIRVEDLRARDARGEPEVDPAAQSIESAAEASLSLQELGERYTEEILRRCNGNKVHAAAILKIDRKTLYRRAERRAREGESDPTRD